MRATMKLKAKARSDRALGRIRRFFGGLFGSERLSAEGRAQELRGMDRERAAKVGERVQGKAEEIGGAAVRGAGEVIGSPKLEAEGALKETEGEVRQDLNR